VGGLGRPNSYETTRIPSSRYSFVSSTDTNSSRVVVTPCWPNAIGPDRRLPPQSTKKGCAVERY